MHNESSTHASKRINWTGGNVTVDLSQLRHAMNDVFVSIYNDQHRNLVLVGGAGSGKSVWATQKLLGRLIGEIDIVHRFAVFRKVAATNKESTHYEISQTIHRNGWGSLFRFNRTDHTITFKPTGAAILFRGVDDSEKLKSLTGITGTWIEEATELTEKDFTQINLRLRGETARYKQHILTFNPISHLHWLKKRFFDTNQHGKTRTLRTTYKHNQFIDEEYKQTIELLAEQSPQLYNIYGLGEWGILEGLVYAPPRMLEKWPMVNDKPRPIDFYGLDFGVNNPCALVACALHDVNHTTRRGDVYLKEVLYRTQLDNTELIDLMKALGVSKTLSIYCDSAEPDRIKQIKRAGFNAKPAHKGPGSVMSGIDTCKSLTLHTLTSNTNLNAEFGSYVWGESRDGSKKDNPVPFNDHALDAMRYAIWTYLRKPPLEIINIGF